MKTQDDLDKYALNLGKIVSTLQSLEFCLRAILLEDEARKSGHTSNSTKYHELKVGDHVPLDAFTNYDTLGKLIRKYNAIISPIAPELVVNESVVDTRDALAHGRAASFSQSGDMHLLKFSEPENGQVEVTYAAELNADWFKSHIQSAREEMDKIMVASDKLGMRIFGDP